MEERDYKFNQEKKDAVHKILLEDRLLPELPYEIDHVSYLDGSKVYFQEKIEAVVTLVDGTEIASGTNATKLTGTGTGGGTAAWTVQEIVNADDTFEGTPSGNGLTITPAEADKATTALTATYTIPMNGTPADITDAQISYTAAS